MTVSETVVTSKEATTTTTSPSKAATFGHSLLPSFPFSPTYKNLNHGSFGSTPLPVTAARQSFQALCESTPDVFIRYQYYTDLDASRLAISQLLKAPLNDVVLVQNATVAVNTVLRAFEWKAGDVILQFSTIYGSCGKTIAYITDTTVAESITIPLIYPTTNAAILESFTTAVAKLRQEGKNPKICLYDTISSLPGIRFPFESLTALCREEGVLSLIDGAHSVGQIPLNISDLQPDFFVSNCHKWLYTPRGSAVFYVNPSVQHLITTTVPTSHFYTPKSTSSGFNPLGEPKKSGFLMQFESCGTGDFSAYLCIPAALKFRQEIGGEAAIMSYCNTLAAQGGDIVADILGTKVMELDPTGVDGGRVAMVNVELPIDHVQIQAAAEVAKVYSFMTKGLAEKYSTFIAMAVHGGKSWCRLSAQVYLEVEDFEWAGIVLKEMCELVNKGEYA